MGTNGLYDFMQKCSHCSVNGNGTENGLLVDMLQTHFCHKAQY